MEDFMQTNMFAWICSVFAHLIVQSDIQKLATYADLNCNIVSGILLSHIFG